MILFLYFITFSSNYLKVNAEADQAPCTTVQLYDYSLPLCANFTLATTNVTFWSLDNGQQGYFEFYFRPYFSSNFAEPNDIVLSHLVCRNSIGFCDECVDANFTNTSDPLTINCTAKACICEVVQQAMTYHASLGGPFSSFNTSSFQLIDFDSGPYNTYIGNTNPFNFYDDILTVKRTIVLNDYKQNMGFKNNRKRSITVFVSFEQPIVSVTPSEPVIMFVWISILSNNKMITCNATCTFVINEAWLITSEDLIITVYIDDVEVYEKSFKTIPVSFCPIPNNPFSMIWLQSWECMGATGRFFLIMGYLGAVVLICFLVFLLIKTIWCAYNGYQTNVYLNVNAPVQNIPSTIDTEEDVLDFVSLRSKVMNKLGMQHTIMIFFFLLTICSASACTNAVISTAKINTCFENSTYEGCKFLVNQQLALSGVGASSCLNYINEKGESIREIKVTYTSAIFQIPLKKLYYTSDWKPMGASKRICSGQIPAGNNALTQHCSDWNNMTGACLTDYGGSNTMICNGFTNLNEACATHPIDCLPGSYTCQLTSNKGCGAFDYGEAFVFGKYAFQPIGPIMKVSAPEIMYLIPKLKVEISTGNETFQVDILYEDSIVQLDGITIEIIGNLYRESNIFSTNKIITGLNGTDGPVSYYGYACEQNVPCQGSVGDLQSSLDTRFHTFTDSLDQFIYPLNTVDILPKDGALDFKFPRRGLYSQLPVLTKLPEVINGELWTVSEDTLYIHAINAGELLIKVSSYEDLLIEQKISTVCLKIEGLVDNTLLGCSNCLQGVVLVANLSSTCDEGLVTFNLECHTGAALLNTHSCLIKTTVTTCEIRINPSTDHISCILNINANGVITKFPFDALSPEIETITNTTGETIIVPPSSENDVDINTTLNLNGFWDWFNSLTGWKAIVKWIIVTIISIVIFAISSYLVYTIIYIIKSYY